jgi:hypothetical protein
MWTKYVTELVPTINRLELLLQRNDRKAWFAYRDEKEGFIGRLAETGLPRREAQEAWKAKVRGYLLAG